MSWAKNSVGERGDNIGLPDVTTADNGKIMEVESGEWKLKEGSGGGGGIPAPENPSDGDVLTYSSTDSAWVAAAPSGAEKFIVTYEFGEGDAVVANKTYAQIRAAYTDGKEISAVFLESSGTTTYLYLAVVLMDETDGAFRFREIPSFATDDPDSPTEITISQEEIVHGTTDSVESIKENYTYVTIPLT